MDSIVFGPIRWCVWSFRLSSPLRLPHLKFLFVCLYTVEDEKHFMLECPAYQEIRSEFGELFDYCEGDLRKLMCHPKQHMLAKLVHKMRVFRDEDTEWVFDLQLDRFESSEDESCGNVSSDEYENELVEVDDISQFGFLEAP